MMKGKKDHQRRYISDKEVINHAHPRPSGNHCVDAKSLMACTLISYIIDGIRQVDLEYIAMRTGIF